MDHAAVITISGIKILLLDFSGLSGDKFLNAIEDARSFCLAIPKEESYPSITDLSGAKMNGKIREALKAMGQSLEQRRPTGTKVKPRAIVGLGRLERAIAAALTEGTKYFDSREEAISYMSKQNIA